MVNVSPTFILVKLFSVFICLAARCSTMLLIQDLPVCILHQRSLQQLPAMAKMKQGETSKAVKQLNKEQEASKLRQAKRSCSRSHFIIERTFVPNLMLNTTSAWRWHMSVCHCRDEMCIIQRQQPTWRNQSHLFHANNLHCCSVVTEEN